MRNLFINESVILPYGYFPTVWLPMEMEYRPAFLLPFVIQDMSYFRCFFYDAMSTFGKTKDNRCYTKRPVTYLRQIRKRAQPSTLLRHWVLSISPEDGTNGFTEEIIILHCPGRLLLHIYGMAVLCNQTVVPERYERL